MKTKSLSYFLVSLALFLNACSSSSAASPTEPAPTLSPEAPTAIPTDIPEVVIPSDWETHTDPELHFSISYPSEMEGADNGDYSWTLNVKTANPDEAARNFIYVSFIPKGFHGASGEIYNYSPADTDILLAMQVGESKSLREGSIEGFTYTRLPDTVINGQTAMGFENVKPWEFPAGTKEIRYYLHIEGFALLLGGYVDTTGSDQPGTITEALLNEIISAFQALP